MKNCHYQDAMSTCKIYVSWIDGAKRAHLQQSYEFTKYRKICLNKGER